MNDVLGIEEWRRCSKIANVDCTVSRLPKIDHFLGAAGVLISCMKSLDIAATMSRVGASK